MSRTVVVSDLHGEARLLERALEAVGFGAGDRLVIAGDLIDVGRDDTVGLATELEATILAGNHEVCAALGILIQPQNPESLERGPEFAQRFVGGKWALATAADGWLITHAGVSTSLNDVIEECDREPDRIAAELNGRFRTEMAAAVPLAPLDWEDIERFRLIGSEAGPLWFRPRSLPRLPGGLPQVVGHTPPETYTPAHLAALHAAGWRLIEPGGRGGVAYRCCVIEDGHASVISSA